MEPDLIRQHTHTNYQRQIQLIQLITLLALIYFSRSMTVRRKLFNILLMQDKTNNASRLQRRISNWVGLGAPAPHQITWGPASDTRVMGVDGGRQAGPDIGPFS